MPTVAELLAQKAALEKQIADVQREEKASAIAQVRTLMAQYGLTVADLGSRVAATGTPRGPRAGGGKVAAKYRNQETGETWSGRGLQPKWLKAALATGKQLSDFAV
jgi:DNA-binding protein H-NS